MNIRNIRASVAQFMADFIDAFKYQHHNVGIHGHQFVDVEMSVLGVHSGDTALNDVNEPDYVSVLPSIPTISSSVPGRIRRYFTLPELRLRALGITEYQYNVSLTFVIFVIWLLWTHAGYPAANYMYPLSKSTGQLLKISYGHVREDWWPKIHTAQSINLSTQTNNIPTVATAPHITKKILEYVPANRTVYAPGFYLAPTAAAIPDEVWKGITSSRSSYTPQATQLPENVYGGNKSPASPTLIQKRDIFSQPISVAHHTLHDHNGGLVHFEDGKLVVPPLEKCAHELTEQLEAHDLKGPDSLYVALRECRHVIDKTLVGLESSAAGSSDILPNRKHDQVKRDLTSTSNSPGQASLNQACERYKGLPISNSTKWTVSQCIWDRPVGTHKGRCTDTFCDQFVGARFQKCYKRSNVSSTECKDQYSLDSADDFLEHAPLECTYCLPHVQCEAIEEHCQRVQDNELYHMKRLSFALGILLVAITLAVWIVGSVRRRREYLAHAAYLAVDGRTDIPLRRIPVMPVAPAPAVLRQAGD